MKLRFITSPSLASEIVSFHESGGPSHVDAVLSDGYLGARAERIGDVPAGVQIRPFDYEKPTASMFVDIAASPDVDAKWECALQSKLGEPYDMEGVMSFALPFEWHDKGHVFCSALQLWALRQVGVFPMKLTKPDYEIDPGALLFVLSTHNDVKITRRTPA